jgi:hypothetical protein
VFREISTALYEEVGLEIPGERLRFDKRTNPRGHPAVEGRVYYRGPLGLPASAMPRIKLDLTADEQLVEAPERLRVTHEYSDAPTDGMTVLCYGYVEVFAEKIRALGDRGRSRDLYDVIHLFRRPEARGRAADVLRVLRAKCAFERLAVPTLATIARGRDAIVAQWETMLAHQLPELPPFESFWAALAEFFVWLQAPARVPAPRPYALGAGEVVLRPALGGFVPGLDARRLQMIRFAAANHLCVDLLYGGTRRRIEPYSLRETRAGHVVLHAHRVDTGEHRSYRVDRIEGTLTTDQPFVPRWAIELSPGGPMSIPLGEGGSSRGDPVPGAAPSTSTSATAAASAFDERGVRASPRLTTTRAAFAAGAARRSWSTRSIERGRTTAARNWPRNADS